MKSYFSLLLLILLNAFSSRAQELFLKTYDFGTVENSYQVLSYKGRIFINTATSCGRECSYLTEIDSTGTILWKTDVPDIDIASGAMVIANDTITITGNNDPSNTAFRMAHFTMNGEKLGPTYEIEHPTKKYTNMFLLTTQYFNGEFVLGGPGKQGDTSWSLIYVVNNVGVLDTLITLEPTNYESDLWDSYIDKEGRLTTYHQVEIAHSPVNYRKIFKFDRHFDTVWAYTSESNDDNKVIPHGCELHDGRTILSYVNPQGVFLIHSVRAINYDSTVDWQHNYSVNGSRERYILRLKTLSNGDIMGSGVYSELALIPKVNGSPWLFRMSPEGVLLWERTYFDIDTIDMESRRGAFYDFTELENGDILAVGYFHYSDDDMLIMRLDSNGCPDPDNCHIWNLLTDDEDPLIGQDDYKLYPNPVVSSLYIDHLSQHGKIDYEIFDIWGKLMAKGSTTNESIEVKFDSFLPGIYFIQFSEKGRLILSKKIVKVSSN